MSLFNDTDKLNDDIAGWDRKNLADLRSSLKALNVKHLKRSPSKVALIRVLRSKLRQRNGLTDRISYAMPRHAIFLSKGVSKGHPITNPRIEKNWYNPVVDKNIDELGNIVSDGAGTLIINNLNIK